MEDKNGLSENIYTEGTQQSYYAPQPQNTGKGESKALEICALVFGILSIVCCCCFGLFGVVGLILSIIALATGKKSGLSIAGLICSIMGLLLSITLIVYSLTDESQQLQDEFMKGFREGYESVYEDTEESGEYR